MKNYLLPCLLMILMGFSSIGTAQNDEFRSNVAVSYNFTLTGAILNTATRAVENVSGTTVRAGVPSLQFTYDFGVKKFLSLGFAGSYQRIGFDARDYVYFDDQGVSQTEDFNVSYTRMTLGIRTLFHYANNDRIDLYSGLRFQYFRGEYSDDALDPSIDDDFLGFTTRNKVGIGLTAFGIRYFLSENIGLGWELNIGRPYFSNLSINARF